MKYLNSHISTILVDDAVIHFLNVSLSILFLGSIDLRQSVFFLFVEWLSLGRVENQNIGWLLPGCLSLARIHKPVLSCSAESLSSGGWWLHSLKQTCCVSCVCVRVEPRDQRRAVQHRWWAVIGSSVSDSPLPQRSALPRRFAPGQRCKFTSQKVIKGELRLAQIYVVSTLITAKTLKVIDFGWVAVAQVVQ